MIGRRLALAVPVALLVMALAGRAAGGQAPDGSDGWQIPAGGAREMSPDPATPERLAKGAALYKSKCRRCHGPEGRGDGPDADRQDPPGDLTDARRASRNPEGVIFYKVWNGRARPKMPAFKSDMSRTEVWAVVQYVTTLRR